MILVMKKGVTREVFFDFSIYLNLFTFQYCYANDHYEQKEISNLALSINYYYIYIHWPRRCFNVVASTASIFDLVSSCSDN